MINYYFWLTNGETMLFQNVVNTRAMYRAVSRYCTRCSRAEREQDPVRVQHLTKFRGDISYMDAKQIMNSMYGITAYTAYYKDGVFYER